MHPTPRRLAVSLAACALVVALAGPSGAALFGRRAAASPAPSAPPTPLVAPSVVITQTPYPTPTPYLPPLLLPLQWLRPPTLRF